MATLASIPARPAAGWPLAGLLLGVAVPAALLAGWVPVSFSIAIVFLFAGPHNWLEARYFLGRLPARPGKLWGFFALAAVGITGLTVLFAAIPWLAPRLGDESWLTLLAVWHTAFLLWVAVLATLRSRTNPRRDWGWIWPAALGLAGGAWLAPIHASILLVYLHPLMALWLLDRELLRSRPEWRPAYHAALAAVPVLLAALWWKLHAAPALPAGDELTDAITRHAGADVLTGLSSHFLVAAHTFLEMVHYGVWVLLLPLVGLRSAPWELHTIPAARRSSRWWWGVAGLLAAGLGVVFVLWACFLVDYPVTRQVYFTVALLHVLAEVPFLLRSL